MVVQRRTASLALVLGLSALGLSVLTWSGSGLADAAESDADADDSVTFTIGTTSDMITANPFKSGGGSEYEMFMLNYDMLFNFGQENLEPVSGLAEYPPEQSADGKTWTFTIRDDVTWSDGEPLTAKDIAFTYNLINEKGGLAFQAELGDPIAKDAFVAPDDTTLIWKMQTATLAPLSPPWVPIVPEHIWGKFAAPRVLRPGRQGVPQRPRSRLRALPPHRVARGPVLEDGDQRRLLVRPGQHRRGALPGLQEPRSAEPGPHRR